MSEIKKEWKLPKNIRQIGEAEANRRIYVEDYVFGFLNRPAPEEVGKAILMGEIREQEGHPYVFISGALKVESFYLDDETREELCRQMEQYFPDKQVVGWFLAAENPISSEADAGELLQKGVTGENQVLLVRDVLENDTFAFVMEEQGARQLTGYYIYYDKNKGMQEYLIEENQRVPVEKEAEVKDDAIRRFRKIIREKRRLPEKYSAGKLAYAAGGFLLVTVLALGVTMVYNYDKMKNVEQSLAVLTGNVESQIQYVTDGTGNAEEVMLHMDEGQPQASAEVSGMVTEDARVYQNAADVQSNGDGAADAQSYGNAADAQEYGAVTENAQGYGEVPQDAVLEKTETREINAEVSETETTQSGDGTSQETAKTAKTSEGQETDTNSTADTSSTDGGQSESSTGGTAASENAQSRETAGVARASYVVKVGDTLAGISEMYYGSLEKVPEICALNDITDENTILPGQKILLP